MKKLYLFFILIYGVCFSQTSKIKEIPLDKYQLYLEKAKLEHIPNEKTESFIWNAWQHFQGKNENNNFQQKQGPIALSPMTLCPSQDCNNLGFEDGDFTNWQGEYAVQVSVPWTQFSGPYTSGFANQGMNASLSTPQAFHTLMNVLPQNNLTGAGYDANSKTTGGIYEIPFLSPVSGNYSMRLGNGDAGGDIETITYVVHIDSTNFIINYGFAVVLNDNSHPVSEQPMFQVMVLDSSGNQVSGPSAMYQIDATHAHTDTSFTISSVTYGGAIIAYRKWHYITLDLSPYIGQTISVKYKAADCTNLGHFGYAYIDLFCGGAINTYDYCVLDTIVTINSPLGNTNFQWYYGASMIPMINDTLDHINVVPASGDIYTVTFTNYIGVTSMVKYVLDPISVTSYQINATNATGSSNNGSVNMVVCGPTGITPSFTWYNNPNQQGTPIGTGPTIIGLTNDTFYVHVTAGTCASLDTFAIVYRVAAVGVKDFNDAGNSFSVYPNPATNTLTIVSKINEKEKIIFTNMLGEVVLTTDQNTEIDIRALPAGIYFIHFSGRTKKILKQ